MALLQIRYLCLDRLNHLTSIASTKHEHRSDHDLPFPIENNCAMANGMADADLCNIPYEHRRTSDFFDDDGFDVTHCSDQPEPSND